MDSEDLDGEMVDALLEVLRGRGHGAVRRGKKFDSEIPYRMCAMIEMKFD